MYEYRECGLDGVVLENGYDTYQTEDGEAVGIHDIEGLHRIIAQHLICDKPELSANEVRFLRKELGLSQVTLANILDVGESTLRAYECGRHKLHGSADRLIRILVMEKLFGESKFSEMLERLAQLNRDIYHETLQLRETESGWGKAA